MKFLSYAGLEHLITEIKLRFVQKTSGKDLSTNDFTNLLKNKLDKIESNAQVNKMELIKKNGTNLSIDSAKAVDITVPTKISDLTNDKTYQTKAEILTLISDKGKLKKEVVSTLPSASTADENTMYLVATDKGYAEWIVINGDWEKLGDTSDIDLTQYAKHTDIPTKVGQLENDKGYVTETGQGPGGNLTDVELTLGSHKILYNEIEDSLDFEGPGKEYVEQILTNGNFEKGLDSWSFNSVQNDSVILENDILKFTTDGTIPSSVSGNLVLNHQLEITHKYYAFANVKYIGTMRLKATTYLMEERENNGEWVKLSGLITSNGTLNRPFGIVIMDEVPTDVEIKNIFFIDLTEAFGEGSEPTKEECDKMFLSYYEDGEMATVDGVRLMQLKNEHIYFENGITWGQLKGV